MRILPFSRLLFFASNFFYFFALLFLMISYPRLIRCRGVFLFLFLLRQLPIDLNL